MSPKAIAANLPKQPSVMGLQALDVAEQTSLIPIQRAASRLFNLRKVSSAYDVLSIQIQSQEPRLPLH